MKLVSFAIRNFRSISNTSKLPIRDSVTALIGPNNEGKSNLLRALVTAMEVVSKLEAYTLTRHGRIRGYLMMDRAYNWPQDYPIHLQDKNPEGESQFDLEFELTDAEVLAFKQEVGSSLNGTLPIRITIGKNEPKFSVRKQGPGAKTLSAKADKIAAFIGKRLDFQYVPAVRPASAATNVVEEIVARELQTLAQDEEYRAAVQRIEELQEPILHTISENIRDTLQAFLPNVKGVRVAVPQDARYRALSRSCEVIVDDGTPTNLSRKGDGVQSLAALSLMRHASQRTAKGRQLILAIEEPESHLHPKAIHQLRTVLTEIAGQHQVIITTHCPVFVDRADPSAHILVTESEAAPAESVQEIRDILGVKVSDNLTTAEVVLLVEGEHDRTAIRELLVHSSPVLAKGLSQGALAIDSLLGGGNLAYKASQVRDAMCVVHALIDHDQSGKTSVQRAVTEGLLTIADVTYTSCLGMTESEIEDWYNPALYVPVLAADYSLNATSPHFTSTKKKWTIRMKELFMSSGKGWDEKVEGTIKRRVADTVAANAAGAIHPARSDGMASLVGALEAKLGKV